MTIDMTWLRERGKEVPYVLQDKQLHGYETERKIKVNGEKVVVRTRTEFLLATAVKATEAQVRKWRDQ